ncbi:hypothetical protein HHK36_008996 [Tetracentron sinense]|uniref:RING-type E3 ubiquitin transferase n=1 Tax=Tetracentron sinense TaxID=13715 RepID=A0A835DI03_TETSI|nr:hypothetical protein HHK36_008996 [Tetracentron sinense]
MSVRAPPLVRINGSRNYSLYWCYQCQQRVRISSSNPTQIICPRCLGEFVSEIDLTTPRLIFDLTGLESSPEARLLEALSLMLDPSSRQPNPVFNGPQSENDIRARPRAWIILRPHDPARRPRTGHPPENLVPPAANSRDYFVGPGLNELIDDLTQNDRPGLPPAPASAIDALPIVKITPTHLKNESDCPVCKEEFVVDEEVREMPCNHIFHSDCIVPWLRIHNSCPVCRYELQGSSDSDLQDGGVEDSRRERVRNRRRWRWSQLWPFRAPQNWRYQPLNPQDNRISPSRVGEN